VALSGSVGIGSLLFEIGDHQRTSQPDYFGPPGSTYYPAADSSLRLETQNRTSLVSWGIEGSYHLFPRKTLSPYALAGLHVLMFDPRNADQGARLPNNERGDVYARSALVFPLGVGGEWYVARDVLLFLEIRHALSTTDYLDDFSDGGVPDAYWSLRLGGSWFVFGVLDCDEDGLSDKEEERIGTDVCEKDTDGDQLDDFEEVRETGTDPLEPDSDFDGLRDFDELRHYGTDPRNVDTDGDGIQDGREVRETTTSPVLPDTDGDGLSDGDELDVYQTDPLRKDSDNDGLDDGDETERRTDPRRPDTDGDSLSDGDEVHVHHTNPTIADSDDDLLDDGAEVLKFKTDPLNPDTDNDVLSDGGEVHNTGTDPLNPDTDGDGVLDGKDACPLVVGVPERNGCPAPPKVGTITDFPSVYFLKNSAEFDFSRQETTESLAMIMSYVNQCPGLRVLIEGHASREGSDRRNLELSEMRADRVKSWLTERGVPGEKIAGTIGYGSTKNAVPEPDPDSDEARSMDPAELERIRRQNRRIAVRVVRTCN
jgi:outer membrane protein OmpA-like peptidoglycan-associated protein